MSSRMLISVPGTIQRGNRTLGNPFESLGDLWCSTCKMVVDTDTESSHRNNQYVWKRTCQRCGTVISWGAYQNVPLIEGAGFDAKKQRAAIAFVTRSGADRRGPVRGRACL